MQNICRNPKTHNFDVSVSVEEWKEILGLPETHKNPNLLWALEKWYLAPDYTASCKSLAGQYHKTCNFFNVQNYTLGEIAAKHLKKFRLIDDDGSETYWNIPSLELNHFHNIYTLQLRPELAQAIRESGLFTCETGVEIQNGLQQQNLQKMPHFVFEHKAQQKIQVKNILGNQYPRSLKSAKEALSHANFQCEMDPSHPTFPRQKDGLPYMETHHLVPLAFYQKFPVSLDVPENIVCLCSTCHNQIHYGRDKQKLIEFLWKLRHQDLQKDKIDITLSELLSLYAKMK